MNYYVQSDRMWGWNARNPYGYHFLSFKVLGSVLSQILSLTNAVLRTKEVKNRPRIPLSRIKGLTRVLDMNNRDRPLK